MTSYQSNGTSTPVRRVGAPPVKKEIWSSLLKSVSSGKRLAAKQLVILGGTAESQRDFITSLDTDPGPQTSTRHLAKPPIANDFALGYTYQDVLDTDHEDILARLAIYTLAKPSPKFLPLLRPLFTAQTIPDMLLVILLDWADPWNWIRQLLSWIRLLHALLRSLPAETVQALQDNIVEWRDRKRNDAKDTGADAGATGADADVALPLGPGEWDSPLGVPLCVVCQNANAIEALERESGWKDRHFDFVQQFVRTVLLKHGGSLIYSMPHQATSAGSPLQTLVHSSLGIESMLKKKTLKYNTTDRDHILVPPNFDSWGKIRILTDDFNVEEVSEAWTQDIKDVDAADEALATPANGDPAPQNPRAPHDAVSMYEEVIKNPKRDQAVLGLPERTAQGALEVQCKDAQLFLAEQAEILDELGREDERAQRLQETKKNLGSMAAGDIEEHIGPVQFNMGGIQIDAEDQLKKLKDREASRASELETPMTPPPLGEGDELTTDKLSSFFASLAKKPGSAAGSPRVRRADTPGR